MVALLTSRLRRAFSRWRTIHWIFLGLVIAISIPGLAALVLLVHVAKGGDGSRELSDFDSPAEARAFVSAHLPVPLPNDAVVETLHFERFTDWFLSTRVRLSSREVAQGYLEQVKRARALNDEYCSDAEPSPGARYYLRDVAACGSIDAAAPPALEVRCNTR